MTTTTTKKTETLEQTKKKFKKSPKGNPIDFSGRSGIYLHSEWLVYEGYEDGGAWVHTYRDIEGEKARYAYLKAQALSEECDFNSKMGLV